MELPNYGGKGKANEVGVPLPTEPIIDCTRKKSSAPAKKAPKEGKKLGNNGLVRWIKECVLIATGSACYRSIVQDTRASLPAPIANVRVVECIARAGLKKAFLTLEELTKNEKKFKNGQKVFKKGDKITIFWSSVYERYAREHYPNFTMKEVSRTNLEYESSENANVNENDPLGDVTEEEMFGDYIEEEYIEINSLFHENDPMKKVATAEQQQQEAEESTPFIYKGKRWYGRNDKDMKSVWFIVTSKEGRSVLWQREIDLIGPFLDVHYTGWMCVGVKAVGTASTMARVYHNSGCGTRKYYKINPTDNSTLWIDGKLLNRCSTVDSVNWEEGLRAYYQCADPNLQVTLLRCDFNHHYKYKGLIEQSSIPIFTYDIQCIEDEEQDQGAGAGADDDDDDDDEGNDNWNDDVNNNNNVVDVVGIKEEQINEFFDNFNINEIQNKNQINSNNIVQEHNKEGNEKREEGEKNGQYYLSLSSLMIQEDEQDEIFFSDDYWNNDNDNITDNLFRKTDDDNENFK